MPPLKYSVGSKSTNFVSIAPGVNGDLGQLDRFTALNSSWINRLHPRILPASAAVSEGSGQMHNCVGGGSIRGSNFPPNNSTVVGKEYRIPFSSIRNPLPSFIAPRNVEPPARKRRISHGDSGGVLAAGFGPFQVRETRNGSGRGFEKGAFSRDGFLPLFPRGEHDAEHRFDGVLETKMRYEAIRHRLSSAVHRSRQGLGRIGAGALGKGIAGPDPASSPSLQACFGPWKVESRLKMPFQVTDSALGKSPVFGTALAHSFSRNPPRSVGAACHDHSHDASVSRVCQSRSNLHLNVKPQQPQIQAGKKESEEPFSFWSMGRFEGPRFTSSGSPSFDLNCYSTRKRALNDGDIIVSSKHGRTRCEED